MLNNFIAQYIGRSVRAPGGLGGQCEDLINLLALAEGGPEFSGNAKDAVGQHPEFYDTLTTGPQPGDIVVWTPYAPLAIGVNGHIAIFVSGSAGSFTSFDQNWGSPTTCRLVHHSGAGVRAYLRKRGTTNKGVKTMDTTAVELIFLMTLRRHATQTDLNNNVGRPAEDILTDLQNSQEFRDRSAEWQRGQRT